MTQHVSKILLVQPDPEAVEVLIGAFCRRFDALITCVADAESCLDTDMLEPHDLVVAEWDLEDASGLDLAEHLLTLRSRPVILLADDVDADDALQAMRLGVRDVFPRPISIDELLDSADRALRGHQLHRQHGIRYHRMRKLVRQVIRERRELHQRVDLICRDLVQAQRKLVHKVVARDASVQDL